MSATTEGKSSFKDKLILVPFCAVSLLILWYESRLLFYFLAFAPAIARTIFGSGKSVSHDWRETLILSVIALLVAAAFAHLNPHVFTKIAGKFRRAFALGFAVSSLWWVFVAYELGSSAWKIFSSHGSPGVLLLPAIFVLAAAGLQLKNSLEVAKENLQRFKYIDKLSAEEKRAFETALHQIKKAQNKDGCALLASRCVQILALNGELEPDADDFHALTKELFKQHRKSDAEEISAHYIALIEPTLLP